eukprot:TRINITY_DN108231_c0_g1_i1.p1 TRINITY_DN108231_c0_g1~~TRINITY_DN108231_c0_g1_i1.p1  ORF type:complete len:363 (+),score=50.22 TRINITY_DN108231_c0_g1_i1:76-1164(+)
MFSYITDESIERLRSHKFTSAGSTPLDDFMDPFWTGVAKRIPRHISPNLISVVGGTCAVAAGATAVVATRLESPWLYFVGPCLMFLYMTADAVDGKHARSTQQSSPLGAVVDHGMDAFCAFTTGVAVVITADPKLATARMMLAYCMFHMSWFCAQWGELELGALDQRGITEGEFATMLVLSLPGFLGDVSQFRLPSWVPIVGNLPILDPVEIGVILGCGAVSLAFLGKVLLATKGRRLEACVPFLHMCIHSVTAFFLSKTPFGRANTLFDFIVVGMNAAMLMTKIRLAATLHCGWPLVHFETLPFFLVAAADIAGAGFGKGVYSIVLIWQIFSLTSLWCNTISRICRGLDVPFLAAIPAKKA